MTKIIKVAAAQLSPIFLNKEKTIDKACKAIQEAGENGADLIVFPEAFISGYPDWIWLIPNSKGADLNELYVKLVENAVSVPDDATRQLCKAAKEAGPLEKAILTTQMDSFLIIMKELPELNKFLTQEKAFHEVCKNYAKEQGISLPPSPFK